MINLIEDIEVELTDKQLEVGNQKIQEFVDKMLEKKQSTSFYSNQRSTTISKAARDIFLGKKSEYIALLALMKKFGFPAIDLDMEVRTGKEKGWGVDLPFKMYDESFPNVHVKSCNKMTFQYCKDFSWTFQYKNKFDNFGKDDIFKGTEDLVALVYMSDMLSKTGTVKAIMPWSELEQYLKDPQKPTLIGLKKCIYYKDLLDTKE